MPEVAFIGGCLDGKVRAEPEPLRRYVVAARFRPCDWLDGKVLPVMPIETFREYYELVESRNRVFYVESELLALAWRTGIDPCPFE